MRTLNINKTTVWYVDYLGEVEVKDENGFYTGELEIQYTKPKKVKLNISAGSSKVKEEIFGVDNDIDLVCSSESIKLSKGSLIFLDEPVGNYDRTYDFKVSAIFKSLNHYTYGLKGKL